MKKILLALTLAAASISTVSATEVQTQGTKKVKMIAMNTQVASEACIFAAKESERKARQKYSILSNGITCNGMSIKTFVKKYKNAIVL